jgi:ribosomal protein L11 methyltransferase
VSGYTVLRCRLGPGAEERLGEALLEAPVLGCEIVSPRPGHTEAVIYVEAGNSAGLALLKRALASRGLEVTLEGELEERDWLEPFRERAVAFPVGSRWWIDPDPAGGGTPPAGRIRLVIEPRMAFGSGTHESTQLVLMELEGLPVTGRRVLDVGTGSGILALASCRLGARFAAGLDIDVASVFEARRTAAEQERQAGVRFLAGTVEAIAPHARFDLVLCNMIWERMRPLLPALRRLTAPGGLAVLSGLLRSQEEPVAAELERLGLPVSRRRTLEEWLALVVTRG